MEKEGLGEHSLASLVGLGLGVQDREGKQEPQMPR